MRFARCRPIKVVMLGAGGTGGHIAPHLYRLLYALDRPARFIICDGDIVEEKNLVRQNFIAADLGQNKAQTLAERYACAFGLETEYVPAFIEDEAQLKQLLTPHIWRLHTHHYDRKLGRYVNNSMTELVILIGAVDNNRSRQLCHEIFRQARELVYIDSGNGEHTGQVVCGIKRAGRTMFKAIGQVYPDVLEETDKFPTQLSCAEASLSAPQSIAANIMAATSVVTMVYNIAVLGEIKVAQTTFSTHSVNLKPVLYRPLRVGRRKEAA